MRRLSNPPPHVYSGVAFDRAAKWRADAAWLAAARGAPATRVLLMSTLRFAVVDAADPPCAQWLTVAELGQALPEDAIYLGQENGCCLFALEHAAAAPAGSRFVELRSIGGLLPAQEAGLLAYARGLAHWHERHRFCGACGAVTASAQGGHVRLCTGCGSQHFPRSDPAVIVLVTHDHPALGPRCLLGRSARFVAGIYSTLAGFVEPGESLEETVRRELYEEVGVVVTEIAYQSSQPWPFPASLMIGFRARALDDRLAVDPEELADAGWFSRAELLDPLRRPVKLPNRDSIARHLIEAWLYEE
jgi:NAD+ diphosphatase